ncbi:hypothetical protein J3F84DRAFT_363636 [Trichoderma pleuroticola]
MCLMRLHLSVCLCLSCPVLSGTVHVHQMKWICCRPIHVLIQSMQRATSHVHARTCRVRLGSVGWKLSIHPSCQVASLQPRAVASNGSVGTLEKH